ncbi:protein IQ-DOMAIN 1 [Herrania umbratica]|uniref:Protein IQ-DOMAIN 1 n=1 Tax=Herrania umbratica TaxID=108875 RepID=A0A6J0ZF91_9ROSI|nr:protein IQ-DOMAIN 1 [Herrania umbratica]
MGTARNWFNTVRKKFIKSSQGEIIILHSPSLSAQSIIGEGRDFHNNSSDSSPSSFRRRKHLTRDYIAAIKIQAIFRGHLARRAYKALRSLVKLQAVARGVYVRKQARIALQCMHALVRLQVRVRARQLLSKYSHDS